MRQTHVAGERLFVDYARTTLEVINGLTGEVMTAQLFVACQCRLNFPHLCRCKIPQLAGMGDQPAA
jgi:hypothetical protein